MEWALAHLLKNKDSIGFSRNFIHDHKKQINKIFLKQEPK